MAGLSSAAGTGRRDVDLILGQPGQHRLTLDAVLAEIQHLRHSARRAVDLHLREHRKPLAEAVIEGAHSFVTALDAAGQAGGRSGKAQRIGQVFGAGAEAALLLTAQIGRLERLHQPVTQVERTDTLGCVDLVAADGHRVDVVQLDGDAHPRLHGVHMDDGAAVTALDLGGQTLHVVSGAYLVVDHHAGHEDGILVHGIQHLVDVQCAVGLRLHDSDVIALRGQTFQRALDAGVFEARHHDALAEGAGLGRAQQGQIIALAAAGGKVQLLRLAAQGAGHGGAGGVQDLFAPCAGGIEAGWVGPVLPHGFVYHVCHLGSNDGGGSVIQIMQFRIMQHNFIPAFCA